MIKYTLLFEEMHENVKSDFSKFIVDDIIKKINSGKVKAGEVAGAGDDFIGVFDVTLKAEEIDIDYFDYQENSTTGDGTCVINDTFEMNGTNYDVSISVDYKLTWNISGEHRQSYHDSQPEEPEINSYIDAADMTSAGVEHIGGVEGPDVPYTINLSDIIMASKEREKPDELSSCIKKAVEIATLI
jgi:hypothetical protein